MKILELFGGVIRFGGEELFVFNCLRNLELPQAQIDCLVAEDCGNEAFRSFVESRGGRMFELNTPVHATRFTNHLYRPVCAFFRQHRYDVVHIHSSSTPALAVLAAAAHRAGTPKVIVHSHTTGKADSVQHRLFRFLASLSMRRHVDVYCACSSAAAQWKFMPKYAAQAIIVKNGIDTTRFRYDAIARERMRAQLDIPADAFVIGNIGRLCQLKNQRFLIDVFARIAAADENARLILIGEGEDREMLIDAVAEYGLTGRVSLTGNVTNVQEYLCAMDVFALPSQYEGLGIVAVEAQATGLPVVASKGVPQEIKLTDAVRFLEIANAEQAWAEALCGYRRRARVDRSEEIRAAGYDIRTTAALLKRLYTE